MLHLARRISLRMDIRNLLEFQRSFVSDGHIDPSSQVETMRNIFQRPRHFFYIPCPVQALPNKIWHET